LDLITLTAAGLETLSPLPQDSPRHQSLREGAIHKSLPLAPPPFPLKENHARVKASGGERIKEIAKGKDLHGRDWILSRYKDKEKKDFVQLSFADSGYIAHLALDKDGIRAIVEALKEVIG
jgi:hypothetical protein